MDDHFSIETTMVIWDAPCETKHGTCGTFARARLNEAPDVPNSVGPSANLQESAGKVSYS
jgi:hypothetical protein